MILFIRTASGSEGSLLKEIKQEIIPHESLQQSTIVLQFYYICPQEMQERFLNVSNLQMST